MKWNVVVLAKEDEVLLFVAANNAFIMGMLSRLATICVN